MYVVYLAGKTILILILVLHVYVQEMLKRIQIMILVLYYRYGRGPEIGSFKWKFDLFNNKASGN